MQAVEFCVRNPVKVAVGMLVVVLFGAISLWRLPKQLTPEVRIPSISVQTSWSGASPYEIEHEIVQEQEERLKDVEGMTKMTSESSHSRGRISMEFAVGTNMAEALLQVNSRLSQVPEYPEDADEPLIYTANLSDRPICWFVLSPRPPSPEKIARFVHNHPELADEINKISDSHKWDLLLYRLIELSQRHPEVRALLPVEDVTAMRRFVEDNIEARFDRVPGVADAFVMGGKEEEVQVVVDPYRLAARQMTINDVRIAFRTRNLDTSGGDFWEGKRSYVVRTLGQFNTLEDVEQTILARRDGQSVYVRDVATVRRGYKKPVETYRRAGTELIGIGARAETGANVLELVAGLREAAAELNEGILAKRDVALTEVWSDADYIESSIRLVNQNIVIGGALTIIVLLCFLRSARSTLIIALAVPTSVVGTFLILGVLGRSLNVVSLAGLAFAVGMVVDNSVVVLENIYRHYQFGESPFAAAVRGSKEVWGAILASTLTTLAVFVPVLFVEEQAGQLFRDIAIAISSAVGLSLIVAITVIPTAAAKILRQQNALPATNERLISSQRSHRFASRFVEFVIGLNAGLQRSVPLRLVVVVGFVAGSFLLSYAMFPAVEYLPHGNKNRARINLQPPPGYSVGEVTQISKQILRQMQQYWEADPAAPEAEALDYPAVKDLVVLAQPRNIMVQVQAENPSRIRELLPLLDSIAKAIPDMHGGAYQQSLFPGSGRQVGIELTGPKLDALTPLALHIRRKVPGAIRDAIATAYPSLEESPELHVLPKWEQAEDLGIDATELGYLVDALIDGAFATDFSTGGDKIDLRIMGEAQLAGRTQDLETLPLATPGGGVVPVGAIADIELSTGPNQINHSERRRSITISVRPPADVPMGTAIDRIMSDVIQPLRDNSELADGIQINLGGNADRMIETWLALRFNILLAVVITYLLMAALFESWIHPFVILLSVPLAAVGGFAGLWLVNCFVDQPMDIVTMLGFVILIGVSVNNAILIVHQSLNQMRDHELSPQQAILESVRSRVRPIFMTTATTVMGLLPLVLMPGAGSELYRGLGSVVLGGLVVSTLFTLVLVPTVFSLMLEAEAKLIASLGFQSEARPTTLDPHSDVPRPPPTPMRSEHSNDTDAPCGH
ncbi:MAG: acriflavin resistance protein [Planctomycetaceae bacterium]|jgi:HAE1 family hydrophobic/amphiphilic exporter-1|nr:acriflavin resistance protein [Planctomycetaceae bacterium]